MYLDACIWFASIYLFARIYAAMPQDPDRECTELGRSLYYAVNLFGAIAAVVTSSRMILKIVGVGY